MKNWAESRKMIILGVLTVSSFLLRFFTPNISFVYPDSYKYLSMTKSILRGKISLDFSQGIKEILPPFYSIVNAGISLLFHDLEFSGLLVSAIAGALLIIPVFYLAKTVYDEKAGWVSVILVGLSPILIHWSGTILTESLFVTLFISGVAMGWYAIEKRNRIFFLLCGAIIGLSYMTRIIGLVAIPVMVLWTIFDYIRPFNSSRYTLRDSYKEILKSIAVFSLGFFLVTGAYLVYLHSVYGHWTLSASYGSVAGVIGVEGASTEEGWENLKTQGVSEGPYLKLIRKAAVNSGAYAASLLSMLSIAVVFVILGLSPRRKTLYVVSFIAVYFTALLILPFSPFEDERIRYLSPILPMFLVIASGGITRIHGWIKWQAVRQGVVPVLIGIVLLSTITQAIMFEIQFSNAWAGSNSQLTYKRVGLWMEKNLPHPLSVMSRKPFIPYYADATWFTTPATYDEVIKLANAKGIGYLVIDRNVEFSMRPELRFLFDPKQAPKDLQYMGGIKVPRSNDLYIGIYKIKLHRQ